MHSSVIIIGAGPAGLTAGIYTARAGLKTTLITGAQPGGQLLLTNEIENFSGFENISGIDLMEKIQIQAAHFGVQTRTESVLGVDLTQKPFHITTEAARYTADSLIIATGASPKWLGVPGEDKFKGKGIGVCATCDGFFYRKKKVAIIGGGNTAAYESLMLSQIADHVTLIHRRGDLRSDQILTDRVLNNPKITVLWNTSVLEFIGNDTLSSLKLFNEETKQESLLPIDGAFVAIGHQPNSKLFENQIEIDSNGYIVTGKHKETSVTGVFACGDVQEPFFRQAIIAAGSGAMAALSAEKFLLK